MLPLIQLYPIFMHCYTLSSNIKISNSYTIINNCHSQFHMDYFVRDRWTR